VVLEGFDARMPRCGVGCYGMAWHSRVLVSIERGNAMSIDLLIIFLPGQSDRDRVTTCNSARRRSSNLIGGEP
jgi:hypothetical protein